MSTSRQSLRDSETDQANISDEDQALITELSSLISTQSPDPDIFKALADVLRSCHLENKFEAVLDEMSQHFALSETKWLDWLSDATPPMEDRCIRLKLHAQSIKDNPISIKLWSQYIEFLEAHYDDDALASDDGMAQSAFSHDLDSIYRNAIETTKFHLEDSHIVWDRYKEQQIRLLDQGHIGADSVVDLFLERLKIPHMKIAETFEQFSTFVTAHDNQNYDALMKKGNKFFQQSRAIVRDREEFESNLATTNHVHESYMEYIQWQIDQPVKSHFYQELNVALFQRAMLQHPDRPEYWDKLYTFYLKHCPTQLSKMRTLLEESVRHCPKDGDLWAHLVRICDKTSSEKKDILSVSTKGLNLVEQDTHHISAVVSATFLALRSGLASGKAGYAAEDLLIVVEDGIMRLRQSELIDPDFVLDRLLIDGRVLNNQIDQARRDWKSLVKVHGSKALFWLRYLHWELLQNNVAAARTLLKSGCMKTQDAPQIIYEASTTFELQYGNTVEYEKTASVVRKATQQYLENAQPIIPATENITHEVDTAVSLKRKSEEIPPSNPSKRSKLTEDDDETMKRDRESTSVIVTNLDQDISSDELIQFFSECGAIKSIKIKKLQSTFEAAAVVEFSDALDMSAALTRTMKSLNQRQVLVDSACETVLFVSNWPPAYGEDELMALFEKYGKVLDIRMPSLMYDQKRKFAYVQMSSKAEALAAISLDKTELGDKYFLSVKVSNPKESQDRKATVSGNRELFVKRISWDASEADLEALFHPYGKIVSLRMPSTISPRHHDGIAFVEFENAESAQQALELQGKVLKHLALEVSISEQRPRNRSKKLPVKNGNAQKSSSHTKSSDVSQEAPPRSEINAKTLGVMNLPDTVSEDQLKSIFEGFGVLRKVNLRPDHSGAIIEYNNQVDAGKAALALEGHIISGKQMEIGTYEDLMRRDSAQVKTVKMKTPIMAPRKARLAPIRGQAKARNTGTPAHKPQDVTMSKKTDASPDEPKKDQDFFRSLLQEKRQ